MGHESDGATVSCVAEVFADWAMSSFASRRQGGVDRFRARLTPSQCTVFAELDRLRDDAEVQHLLRNPLPAVRRPFRSRAARIRAAEARREVRQQVLAGRFTTLLEERGPAFVRVLDQLLHQVPETEERSRRWRQVVARYIVGVVLSAVVVGVVAAAWAWSERAIGALSLPEVFAVATLAGFPGWLFVRFIGFRAAAVWDEYVLNLHRLGLDERGHLPEPPRNSVYHRLWERAGGPAFAGSTTKSIYQKKFDAYFGRNLSGGKVTHVKVETLFPVFLCTAMLAVGWSALLWGDDIFSTRQRTTYSAMAFAFIGAYVFSLQSLIRRFFQGDLKASTYASVLVRFVVALSIVGALETARFLSIPDQDWEPIHALLVGMFPLAALRAVQRRAAEMLKSWSPSLGFNYPLSDLEGLSVWYEARLLEEGIEDMQSLVTANLPEVILHTRVPVGRLIDWIDQAHLWLHLPPTPDPGQKEERQRHCRTALLQLGVRNATSFRTAFPVADGTFTAVGERAAQRLARGHSDLTPVATLTVARVLAHESGLDVVYRWRCWEETIEAEAVGRTPWWAAGRRELQEVRGTSTASITASASSRISSSVRS